VAAFLSPDRELLEPGSEITLDNCEREPIQTPGAIQPHGALLAVSGADRRMARLGVSAELLGSRLDALIGESDAVHYTASGADGEAPGLRPRTVSIAGQRFDGFSYRLESGVVIIEFEPAGPEASAAALADDVASMLAALQSADSPLRLLELAATWVRALTGFDRVWIYRFEPDDHGVIIVEERQPELEPRLGLHFPARDVPGPARDLFLTNRIRFIPDSRAEPSPLVPLVNPVSGDWPDLSAGILRAVSPMHLQYLQNLGAAASVSIALEVDGRLWGLISGHHYAGPRVVERRLRLACEVLGRVASSQLAALLAQQAAELRAERDGHREAILSGLAEAGDGGPKVGEGLVGPLAAAGPSLLALCGADGAAVVIGDAVQLIGDTPPLPVLRALVAALPVTDGPFVTASLAADLPELAGPAAPICGVIALALGSSGEDRLLWFANEYVSSITWGDNGLAPARGRLHPTGSYATWSESVTGTSRPWSRLDRDAVASLGAGIGTVVLRQAEDLARVNTQLARSNGDLAAFNFVVAHDLREPLRNIQSYLEFFLEDFSAAVPADGLAQLATIRRLAQRMDGLMDSLLDHARADRLQPQLEPVVLGEAVADALALLGPRSARGDVAVLDPEVRFCADRDALTHVLMNLMANAVKYSDAEVPRVEIDAHVVSPDRDEPGAGMVVIGIRDNGIGIEPAYHAQIFELFRRLHARDAYGGGSGAGLAIAQRLIQRQGGELWLAQSALGSGSRFCFSVPPFSDPRA
jgi:chemotaxis family two-component system sensor kinase Cph1